MVPPRGPYGEPQATARGLAHFGGLGGAAAVSGVEDGGGGGCGAVEGIEIATAVGIDESSGSGDLLPGFSEGKRIIRGTGNEEGDCSVWVSLSAETDNRVMIGTGRLLSEGFSPSLFGRVFSGGDTSDVWLGFSVLLLGVALADGKLVMIGVGLETGSLAGCSWGVVFLVSLETGSLAGCSWGVVVLVSLETVCSVVVSVLGCGKDTGVAGDGGWESAGDVSAVLFFDVAGVPDAVSGADAGTAVCSAGNSLAVTGLDSAGSSAAVVGTAAAGSLDEIVGAAGAVLSVFAPSEGLAPGKRSVRGVGKFGSLSWVFFASSEGLAPGKRAIIGVGNVGLLPFAAVSSEAVFLAGDAPASGEVDCFGSVGTLVGGASVVCSGAVVVSGGALVSIGAG